MLTHERTAWQNQHSRVAGVDEAGRGPLAGPVVAAAVWIEPSFLMAEEHSFFKGLNDSKQLTEAQRTFFFQRLQSCSQVAIGVGLASVAEIDSFNILRATHLAMARALSQLNPRPDHALVDGRPVPGLPCSSTAIVKGDSASLSIAAASVIAKVTRDAMLVEMDRQYPQYGFARHKGYGTAEHLAALERLGPCPEHRRSYAPVRRLVAPEPTLF